MPQLAEDNVRSVVDWPGYWFLLLERFLAKGDLEAAAEAKRQLERLGVEVRYRSGRALSPSPVTTEEVRHG
jgi:hypothetical protein